MTDAITSAVTEQVTSIIADKVRKDVSLVRGVKKELRSLSRELNTIRRVLVDAERRRFKEDSIKDWLKRLESTAYEMDDLLDEWNFAIRKIQIEQSGTANFVLPPKYKVRSFIMPRCLYFRKLATLHDTAKKIESVKEKLGAIVAEKDRYGFMITSQPIDSPRPEWRVQSTSLIDLEEVCGRKNEGEDLVSKLVAEELGIRIICVVGVGGLGKTTLAKLAYNDSRMESAFQLRVWICVSDPFNESEIANEIIEGAKGIK